MAHRGETTAGECLHTLDAVDVATLWCEPVAVLHRSQEAVRRAIQRIRDRFPFPLRGIDSGSERSSTPIFTGTARGRGSSSPGPVRLETIYADWRLVVSYLQPVRKLIAQERVGSQVRKRYNRAPTPYRRVPAASDAPNERKIDVQEIFTTLNPAVLQRRIADNLRALAKLPRQHVFRGIDTGFGNTPLLRHRGGGRSGTSVPSVSQCGGETA
ncbi:hypothetical protein H5T55_07025 [Candidatus Bipolaricaulota bacterium]|nr:hypothetical protein [Candidatus Bipolaricaulota bacterium]